MAHRRGSFRGRGISESQRRKKTWLQLSEIIGTPGQEPGVSSSFQISLTPPGVGGTSVKGGFIAVNGTGPGDDPLFSSIPEESTILRIRGSLSFPKNIHDPLTDLLENQYSFGIGVAGITDLDANSYPAPLSEASWDGWMFLRQSALPPVEAESSKLDVKAMRKVKSGDALLISVEALRGAGAGGAIEGVWVFDLRILIMLP